MEKGGLGGGVDSFYGLDGGVGSGLVAANEVDSWGGCVTGEGKGRGEGDAGGAADWGVLVRWEVSKRGDMVEKSLCSRQLASRTRQFPAGVS